MRRLQLPCDSSQSLPVARHSLCRGLQPRPLQREAGGARRAAARARVHAQRVGGGGWVGVVGWGWLGGGGWVGVVGWWWLGGGGWVVVVGSARAFSLKWRRRAAYTAIVPQSGVASLSPIGMFSASMTCSSCGII
jgi:hypothetical protein